MATAPAPRRHPVSSIPPPSWAGAELSAGQTQVLARIKHTLATGGRVVIIGAPRVGKSTLARRAADGVPLMCGDPECLVKDPGPGVEYVPNTHKDWSAASQYVAAEFLARPGPWVVEGVGLARALRKWRAQNPGQPPPVELVLWLRNEPYVAPRPGQVSMGKGVATVMAEIQEWLGSRCFEC